MFVCRLIVKECVVSVKYKHRCSNSISRKCLRRNPPPVPFPMPSEEWPAWEAKSPQSGVMVPIIICLVTLL